MSKKWLAAVALTGALMVAGHFAQDTKAANKAEPQSQPQAYIKFDGGQVTFAENMPDCH